MSSQHSSPQTDSGSEDEPQTDRATAHVGLVCTHAMELKTLIGRLDRRRRYADGGLRFTGGFFDESIRVAVVEAGTGFAAHRRATTILIAEHKPTWVISAGFSSSLTEDVRAGDLSLATSICDTHGQQLTVECPIPESKHGTLKTHLVTDRHPQTTAEKRQLAKAHDAGAVDTTSLAVAQICAEFDARFMSIRAILDDAPEEVPSAVISGLFEPAGTTRGNPVSSWISGFRQSPEMKTWTARTTTVSGRLDRFLAGVIRQLGKSDR
jgi:adenosylhomocysteine nucleosidase